MLPPNARTVVVKLRDFLVLPLPVIAFQHPLVLPTHLVTGTRGVAWYELARARRGRAAGGEVHLHLLFPEPYRIELDRLTSPDGA